MFQNTMRSLRKLFLILSGRHRKGESGGWDRCARLKGNERRERQRHAERGLSSVVLTSALEINARRGSCF